MARITSRLRSASRADAVDFPALAAALNDNRTLWTTFAVDLAGDGNALPQALRLQLLNLAQFVHNQTDAVLSGTDDAQALIDINLAVMRGLTGQTTAEPMGGHR